MADDEAEVLDNWEEQADSGEIEKKIHSRGSNHVSVRYMVLDKRLEEMAIDVSNNREKKRQVVSVAGKMMVSDESGPTPFQPQVRILKRDTTASPAAQQNSHVTSPSAGTSQGSSKHSKSLQQREAEYAQARLRIFGSLPPPDDEGETGANSTSNNSIANKKAGDGCIPADGAPQIVKADPSQPRVAILRQPKSPDGTSGFKKPDHT